MTNFLISRAFPVTVGFPRQSILLHPPSPVTLTLPRQSTLLNSSFPHSYAYASARNFTSFCVRRESCTSKNAELESSDDALPPDLSFLKRESEIKRRKPGLPMTNCAQQDSCSKTADSDPSQDAKAANPVTEHYQSLRAVSSALVVKYWKWTLLPALLLSLLVLPYVPSAIAYATQNSVGLGILWLSLRELYNFIEDGRKAHREAKQQQAKKTSKTEA